ncbi:hypothetical protein [Clostridium intestinale]|uniref:WD40-like Beta Propeller Repeat n=1 Tax=Clostridium intestinale DSM 6191 TaxID=1121320 RepID=A0A1M5Y546_9CLOT|nr:hypothetical protein [Clostridium intestinale]SHI07215.1 hypothetical protein SAMN02745941_01865 [Clostridium intestinale DSM 6191]
MKKHFVLKVLVLFISFSILSLWFNPTSIFRKKTNTIVLNDRPINISSIEDSSSYVKIDSTDSFNIDKTFDNSFWINNDEIILASMFFSYPSNVYVEILNTKTNSSTKLDIKNLSSDFKVSPLGNGFLYESTEEYTNEFIRGLNPDEYKKMYNYRNRYYYYSLLDNTSTPILDGLYPMRWLPDGSGFIAKSYTSNSLVIYDIESKSTHTFLDKSSGINTAEISSIFISNDGSTYYFSYYDYKLGMYSIYKMSKKDMTPEKILSDKYLSPEIYVINNNLLLLTNIDENSIFIYDTEKHKKLKTITSSSTWFYINISNDKSMLSLVENGNLAKLSVINLNDPNLTATEIFRNKNSISNISWSNDNKLAFQITDGYNGNNVIYTFSFK